MWCWILCIKKKEVNCNLVQIIWCKNITEAVALGKYLGL